MHRHSLSHSVPTAMLGYVYDYPILTDGRNQERLCNLFKKGTQLVIGWGRMRAGVCGPKLTPTLAPRARGLPNPQVKNFMPYTDKD